MESQEDMDREIRIKALSERSSAIENILKHRFLSDLSQVAWVRDPNSALNISNSEVDDSGYDVVLEHGGDLRHIQLKQVHNEKRPQGYSVRVPFAMLPGACVVVMVHSIDTLECKSYSFYGGGPSEPMPYIDPERTSKHPGRRTSDGSRKLRLNYRDAKYSGFRKGLSAGDLFDFLFPAELP